MTVREVGSDAAAVGRLQSLVGPPSGKWGRRLATAAAAWAAAQQVHAWVKGRLDRHAFTVAVQDTDDIYRAVQAWVLKRMPSEHQRALIAETGRRHEPVRDSSEPNRPTRVLHLHYDGKRSQVVEIDGHAVTVQVEHEDAPGGEAVGDSAARLWRPSRIVFASKTLAGRDAVVAFLQQVASELEQARVNPRLYTATKWGDWRCTRELLPRPLESVVLRSGQLEDLSDDLRRFYAAEKLYVRLGIPWRRGYVLHGPPGTGKTSTAKALAAHHGLDVYYVPLSDLSKDTDLNQLVAAVDRRAVLLFEDVDVVHATRDRDDTAGGITLSGLLNALDGVVTPHGVVYVLTTNNLDVLDPALLRPGRADRIEYMGPLDEEQFCRLVWALTGEIISGAPLDLEERHLTAADVVEVVKRHLDAPADAVPELRARLNGGRPRQGVR